jgi:hypothetical protein
LELKVPIFKTRFDVTTVHDGIMGIPTYNHAWAQVFIVPYTFMQAELGYDCFQPYRGDATDGDDDKRC